MRKIAIIGAGQSGLQLALGLQKHGYSVTVVSNRTPEQVFSGNVTSSQAMFDNSLQAERDLGINFWEKDCPGVQGVAFTVPAPDGSGKKAIFWESRLDHYFQGVDQRVKFSGWMKEFAKRGGDLQIKAAGVQDLESFAKTHDLVLVASGKGEIGRLFETNKEHSPYSTAMRALSLTYVKGMVPRKPFTAVSFNLIPGVGEYFVYPALTVNGVCEIMVFEGVPGGPMDCWSDVKTPEQHLKRSKEICEKFLPWEAERNHKLELTDDRGIMTGRFAPVVRKPLCKLPSGRVALGVGDTVVTNDPLTGQGSNTACKAAKHYMQRIVERGDRPFDAAWMQETFDQYWNNYAQWVTKWTNSLLIPPAPQILELMGAAQGIAPLAKRIAEAFNNPPDVNPWWFDANEAHKVIGAMQAHA
ncbi:MAG TPA: styrene monooxygenase/indole monooxygenase family protein [Candidatus Acidoferrum sp.]|nr:styrene monooxygenase/indole monooxygenase family protein [Candidatus Acidoferrum sp.]